MFDTTLVETGVGKGGQQKGSKSGHFKNNLCDCTTVSIRASRLPDCISVSTLVSLKSNILHSDRCVLFPVNTALQFSWRYQHQDCRGQNNTHAVYFYQYWSLLSPS